MTVGGRTDLWLLEREAPVVKSSRGCLGQRQTLMDGHGGQRDHSVRDNFIVIIFSRTDYPVWAFSWEAVELNCFRYRSGVKLPGLSLDSYRKAPRFPPVSFTTRTERFASDTYGHQMCIWGRGAFSTPSSFSKTPSGWPAFPPLQMPISMSPQITHNFCLT